METEKIQNAKIISTSLGRQEYYTFLIVLDHSGGTQGWGNWNLKWDGGYASMKIIFEILRVVGVDNWEDLKGMHVRIKRGEKITAIGNLIKDEWLDLSDESHWK